MVEEHKAESKDQARLKLNVPGRSLSEVTAYGPKRAQSAEVLPDLFGAEGADAVEAEAEDEAVLFPNANVERVVLRGYGATVPRITNRNCRTYQRTISFTRARLEIKEE